MNKDRSMKELYILEAVVQMQKDIAKNTKTLNEIEKKVDGVIHERFLKLQEVLAIFPVSKSSWYIGVKDGIYPAPYKLGPRAAGYKLSEIRKLINSVKVAEPTEED